MKSYTFIVTRKTFFACLLGVFSASFSSAQNAKSNPPQQDASKAAQQSPDEGEPPEEDESLKPRVYAFNPLEAERSIKVGNFYMHQATPRGYRAAAMRFEEASKFNPNSAEAFLRLGEAEEKLKSKDKAKIAFGRAVQIDPSSKIGKEAEKKLSSLR